MREIYYNSDITPKATNEIKLLSLYYDKINIVNDVVYSPEFDIVNGMLTNSRAKDLQFIPKSFFTDYKLLLDENLISVTKRDENENDIYGRLFSEKISELLNANENLIFPKHPTEKNGKIITEEVYDVMKHMLDFNWGKSVDPEFMWWYYAFKLKWFLKLLMEGETCVSSSNNLNKLFNLLIKDLKKNNQLINDNSGQLKSLALDALKISLPNPSMLTFEQILELKFQLKDELALFYQTINSIEIKNKQLFGTDIKESEYQNVFFTEIQKPLKELEIKMQNLQSKTFRGFINQLKDYKSYVPMIGTVVAQIPTEYAVLTSLGIITGQTLLEYKESKREVACNGLYFLLKVKNSA